MKTKTKSARRRKSYSIIRRYGLPGEYRTSCAASTKRAIKLIDGNINDKPSPTDKIVKFVEVNYGDRIVSRAEYRGLGQLIDDVVNNHYNLLGLTQHHPLHRDIPEAKAELEKSMEALDQYFTSLSRNTTKADK